MKYALPFPYLEKGELPAKVLRQFSRYGENIAYFYFRIPYLEGRDSSKYGLIYAEKCKEFLRRAYGSYRCVLDIKLNASRPAINRYYRSNYIANIIREYGFDGIIARDVGNMAYFVNEFKDLDVYLLTDSADRRLLDLLYAKAGFSGIIGVGSKALQEFSIDIRYDRGYIVNEACQDGCENRLLMYSGRASLSGFCKECKGSRFIPYYIKTQDLARFEGSIDTAVISGALKGAAWVEHVLLSYLLGKETKMEDIINGPQVRGDGNGRSGFFPCLYEDHIP